MGFLSISHIIDHVSKLEGDNLAIQDLKQVITYRELKTLSDRVSCYLQHLCEYEQGGIVLVHTEKNVYLPVVLLGILKAGLAYIPLSEFHTHDQIMSIALDANVSIFLTDNKNLEKKLVNDLDLCSCDMAEMFTEKRDIELPPVQIEPNDLAYILYTSGSTGKPKGVMIEHAQLSYYSAWFAQQSWGSDKSCLPFTSAVSFAAAVSQIFYSLRRGELLYILPEDCLRNFQFLLTWFGQHHHAALYCVPTVWRELLVFFKLANHEHNELALPKVVLLSGEAVPETLKRESFQLVPELRLFNLYGPTEATANATFCELLPEIPVHLGLGIEGTDILLLDDQKKRVTKGEVGELFIAGEGVARGYLNDPERTQQRFCSVLNKQGQRIWAHASGDLVKINEDDRLIYLGRKDCQLKLNGIRFDAEDIEQLICQYPSVSACLVTIYHNLNDIQSLVAYVLLEEDKTLLSSKCKTLLRRQLSAFLQAKIVHALLPSHIILLSAFPKLPNGKVDKSRLPHPKGDKHQAACRIQGGKPRATVKQEFGNELSIEKASIEKASIEKASIEKISIEKTSIDEKASIEQAMLAIWQSVLECGVISPHDNIIALGANSLHLIRAQSLIQLTLGYMLPFNDFFEYPSIEALSKKVMSMKQSQQTSAIKPVRSKASLSHEQTYFMMLDLFSDNTDYQIYFCHEIKGELDKQRLRASLLSLVEQNPVLLTRINLDEPDDIDVPFTLDDIRIIEKNVSQRNVDDPQWLRQYAQSVCADIDSGPLIHFQLLTVGDEHHVLLHTVHHMLFDHESIKLWSHQLVKLYQTLAQDKTKVAEQVDEYGDYIAYQQGFMLEHRQAGLTFWREQLSADFTLSAAECVSAQNSDGVKSSISNGITQDAVRLCCTMRCDNLLTQDYRLGVLKHIEEYAKRQQTTVSMVLLTAFYSALLQTHTQQACQVGIPVSNRSRADFPHALGCFVNMINFSVQGCKEVPFTALLTQCRTSFFKRLPYAYMSYGELVDDYRQEKQSAVLPFLANFNYLTQLPEFNLEKSSWVVKELQPNAVRQGIMLTVEEHQDALMGYLSFDIQQYSNDDINQFSSVFENIINREVYQ
ncbi:non-ribosomal peptide synthetase [uncultured Shewanella sp.]|uniref:non-ribosomal peptide synthetase n=1 Tax=uncultured Shewanella sp. TaxID=173975 RepID=UPI00260B6E71|nr:non-ribosomal peptide synthetase [uncultured Shewanella sp.]